MGGARAKLGNQLVYYIIAEMTRAYPVSDAQCNHAGPVINMRRCKQSLRIASLNIGTMTGKSRELADLMKTRRIDVMYLQETRWGGNKARELGDGCKLFYSGGKKQEMELGYVSETIRIKCWRYVVLQIG